MALLARLRAWLWEIRPAPAPREIDRKRVYGWGLIGMALLIVLAWANNARGLAVATLVALALGLLWVGWMAHRSVIATALAMIWWFASAPILALLGTMPMDHPAAYAGVGGSAAIIVGMGVMTWMWAVLARTPRVWLVIVGSWVILLVAIVIGGLLAPRYTFVVGLAAVFVFLAWRSGLMTALLVPRRVKLSTEEERSAFADELAALPGTFRCVSHGDDVLVVGPTGVYLVREIEAEGKLRSARRGTRLAVGDRVLDQRLVAVANTAGKLVARLGITPQPVVVLTGADFAHHAGMVPVAVRRGERSEDVIALRPELLAARLQHGHSALTYGQVRRVAARARRSS